MRERALVLLRGLWTRLDVIRREGVDRVPECGVDDDLEEGKRGTHRVCPQRERRGSSEKAVHDVVWVRSQPDQEEQLRALLDGANDALHGYGA